MSSTSENGSEAGTPGNASSRSPDLRSSSTTPSPSGIKYRMPLNLSSDENDFKLSKCTSPNGYHTPNTPEGVLTPPIERDSPENPLDSSETEENKLGRSNGRLKFFKDGMLCLELSHHDEGQKTKWIQIRGKSFVPQIVHVTKEAVIPSQLTPQPLFSGPNGNHLQSSSRLESSTSHSMSDDGSSILSSPRVARVRDSSWRKQPVPQRCLSAKSNFYMKPAACVVGLNFRHELRTKARLCTLRRPYCMPDFVTILRDKAVPLGKCGLSLNANSSRPCTCDGVSVFHRQPRIKSESPNLRTDKNRELSGQSFEKKLSAIIERRLKIKLENESNSSSSLKTNGSCVGAPRTPAKSLSTRPSKREVKDRDSICGFRPITKKSQQKDLGKTILSVPGQGLFSSRLNDDMSSKMGLELPLNFSKSPGIQIEDTTDGKSLDRNSVRTNGFSRIGFKQKNNRKSKTTSSCNAKYSSSSNSTSILKSNIMSPELSRKNLNRLHPLSDPNPRCAMPYSPPPKVSMDTIQQGQSKYLENQTVSKVISYTINSLLGTDSNGSSNSNKLGSSRNHKYVNESGFASPPLTELTYSTSKIPPESVNKAELKSAKDRVNIFNVGEQDPSSFLRHLLDSSDPIPPTLNATVPPTHSPSPSSKIPPTPPKKRSAINNHCNNNNSTASTAASKTRRSPKNEKNNRSQLVNTESTSIVIPKPVPTNSLHSHLAGSKLATRDSTSAAIAAASNYQHYPFIPTLNTPNSYFHPRELGTLHPSQSIYAGSGSALNLSHRGGWSPFFLPPLAFPFHDRASDECQDLSMNSRNLYNSDSRQSSTSIDNDVPLNLCKKPRPS